MADSAQKHLSTGAAMEKSEVLQRLQEVREEDGPWSAHHIHLVDDIYTILNRPSGEDFALVRIVQTVADIVQRPLQTLRVLDLACLEGLYGLEFARHGAEVVGIEGRAASVRKANVAREALGLQNITFHQDDVRNLSAEKYGRFDVVLCLGILYHLGAEDVPKFVHRISSVCDRLAIVHTQIGMKPRTSIVHDGHEYRGHVFTEYLPGTPEQEKETAFWGSLDNDKSLWLTRSSLLNLLEDAGFTSVMECRVPYLPTQPTDHVTLAAIKGERPEFHCVPELNRVMPTQWPEHVRVRTHPGQRWYYELLRRFGRQIPGLRLIKRLLGLQWHSRSR